MRKNKEELNVKEINDVVVLSKKILKVLFAIIILSIVFITLAIFRETNIFKAIFGFLKVLTPLFVGIIIAWLLDPLVTSLEKKKVKRVIGTIFVFFAFILIVYLFFRIAIPMLYKQINEFITIIPNLFMTVSNFTENIFDKFSASGIDVTKVEEHFYETIENLSINLTTELPQTFISLITGAISSIGTFGLGLIIGFYLLIDFNVLKRLLQFIPRKNRTIVKSIYKKINTTFRDYLQGTLLISSIIFVISSIAFAIIGVPSPMLFGLICGITNVIPYIGPWIGGAIVTLVALTVSPFVGVLAAIIAFIMQQIDSLALQPLIMSKAVKLHPVTIMMGLLIFEHFFGILGMIIATPVISGLKIILSYLNDKYDLIGRLKDEEKNIEIKEV